jgi:hypothetical protein
VNGQGGSGDDSDVVWGLTKDRRWLASGTMTVGLNGGKVLMARRLREGESERRGCGGMVVAGSGGTLL